MWNDKKKMTTVLIVAAVVVAVVLAAMLIKSPTPEKPDELPETTPSGTQTPATTPIAPETQPPETLPPAVWNTVPEMEATYEHWLAAAMVMAASMHYPDFQIEGIYAASATDMDAFSDSQGVYLQIITGGESLCIHSAPLKAERSEVGTTDISTAQLGFATFDPVDAAEIDLSGMESLSMEDLGELMQYSLLVSLYMR